MKVIVPLEMKDNNKQPELIIIKIPLLTRSSSYDCTEKVGKWLSSTTPPASISIADENMNLNNTIDFQVYNSN